MPDKDDLRKNTTFKKICREAANAASRFNMIEDGDKILVGISGGEDSITLMHVLQHIQKHAPFRFSITAATVDMDFAGFNIAALEEYCRNWGWDWQNIHMPGQALLKDKGAEQRPCALCSRLRRGQLHALADKLNCNKIALGQQLDDLCVSLLMALFRGGGLKTMGPNVAADSASKRLIRPLCTVRKSLIHQLGIAMEYPKIRSCPYEEMLKKDGDRAFLEELLAKLELRFKDICGTMLKAMGDVRLAHLLDTRYLSFTEEDPDKGKL